MLANTEVAAKRFSAPRSTSLANNVRGPSTYTVNSGAKRNREPVDAPLFISSLIVPQNHVPSGNTRPPLQPLPPEKVMEGNIFPFTGGEMSPNDFSLERMKDTSTRSSGIGIGDLFRTPPLATAPLPHHHNNHCSNNNNFYGLPRAAQQLFTMKGVTKLYEWQDHVLTRSDVLCGGNFVYSLPTSGGKTLVAEIMLLRTLLNGTKKSGMFVLPFVSVAEEKCCSLKLFAEALSGFRVEGYYGTTGRRPPPKTCCIFVCTIEKANALYNDLCEEGRPGDIGTVVVDELHMVGEPRRGATLELFLSKILAVSPSTQIIGMSATVPNLPEIAKWLRASCYVSDFRPVPLKQYSVCNGAVLEHGERHERSLTCTDEFGCLLELICEVVPAASVLVFCPSRQSCVNLSLQIASALESRKGAAKRPLGESLAADLKQMGQEDGGALASTTPFGVAFHHSGLLMEERELIERAFRSRHITVLCCTSTLAAGVNLPARRVIFKGPYIGRDFLTKSRYLQMCGRAGRAGLDSYGESYLVLQRKDLERGHALMRQPTEDVHSVLLCEMPVVARALAECVGVGIFKTTSAAQMWGKTSLLSTFTADSTISLDMQQGGVVVPCTAQVETLIQDSFHFLEKNGFVQKTKNQGGEEQEDGHDTANIELTPLGSSTVRSALTIHEALLIKEEMIQLQRTGLILEDDLHICYFLTPPSDTLECNYRLFEMLLNRFSDARQRIVHHLGVDEYYISQCAMGLAATLQGQMSSTAEGRRKLFTTRRFYSALILCDLLNEMPLPNVEAKYAANRGQLQNLMKSAGMFSSSMTSFCNSMSWHSLEAVFTAYVKRIGFGVKPDLLPLMEIKGVQPSRARALWAAGFKNAESVAAMSPEELQKRVKDRNGKESKAAKYFSIKAAVCVVREAARLMHAKVQEKKGELLELTQLTSRSQAPSRTVQ